MQKMNSNSGRFQKGHIPWHKGKVGLVTVWHKGRTGVYSAEALKKMSDAKRGKRLSDETRKRMSEAFTGRSHSEETKEKMSRAHKGEKSYRWISDRSLIDTSERNITPYKDWRKSVWVRDGFKCKMSNEDCSGRIEAHHILGYKNYPELRYDVNNGITLCHFHHPKKRIEEKELAPYFKELILVTK